jgi:hypothetical protein
MFEDESHDHPNDYSTEVSIARESPTKDFDTERWTNH